MVRLHFGPRGQVDGRIGRGRLCLGTIPIRTRRPKVRLPSNLRRDPWTQTPKEHRSNGLTTIPLRTGLDGCPGLYGTTRPLPSPPTGSTEGGFGGEGFDERHPDERYGRPGVEENQQEPRTPDRKGIMTRDYPPPTDTPGETGDMSRSPVNVLIRSGMDERERQG